MMIAFNQMNKDMGDQGFAILTGESIWEFSFCVLIAMNAKNCEHQASPLFLCRYHIVNMQR